MVGGASNGAQENGENNDDTAIKNVFCVHFQYFFWDGLFGIQCCIHKFPWDFALYALLCLTSNTHTGLELTFLKLIEFWAILKIY